MEDLIERQAAIEALDKLDYTPGEWAVKGLTMCKDAIKAVPSAQPDRKTYSSMTDIEFDEWLYVHGVCTNKPIPRKIVKLLIEDAINETLSAQPEQRWIPCSERLPEDGKKHYWVCTDTGYQCECRWTNINHIWTGLTTDWHWHIMDIPQYSHVVAWRELPEPYKEEQDGNDTDTD